MTSNETGEQQAPGGRGALNDELAQRRERLMAMVEEARGYLFSDADKAVFNLCVELAERADRAEITIRHLTHRMEDLRVQVRKLGGSCP